MKRTDVLLLVLSAAHGKSLTPVQLQKSLFLVGKKWPGITEDSFYEFEPHNYGPFCKIIYDDMELLEMADLVKIHKKSGRNWSEYSATEDGLVVASKLDVPADVVNYVRKLVSTVKKLSFADLVKAVYNKYPEFRLNSVFRG